MLSSLPPEQLSLLESELRSELLLELLEKGIETEQDLRLFSFYILGFNLPECRVCPGHSSPMDFLIHDYFGPGGTTIVEACRDGYKTFGLAIANIAAALGKRARILHLGAVQQQAKNGDKYLGQLLESSGLLGLINKRTTVSTSFLNGAEIQIASCTIKQTNSPRATALRLDEGDLADPQAVSESKAVISTDVHGNTPSWTMVSTRKFPKGNLVKEIETAEKSGDKVFRWCYKEVTQHCPDERSGTDPRTIYVDLTDLEWMTQEEYQKRSLIEDDDGRVVKSSAASYFQPFQVFDKCLDCPIVATCRGDLKKAGGLRPIEDLIRIFPGFDRDDWISQKECRGIPSTARIYRAFSKEKNVAEFPIWRSSRTGEILGEILFGKDFGFEHPDVSIAAQLVEGHCGHKHLWVHEAIYLTHKSDDEVIQHLAAVDWFALDKDGIVMPLSESPLCLYGEPDAFCVDPSDRKGRSIYRKHGFRVLHKSSVVKDGIREVRKLIHPIDCNETHLHIHSSCARLIQDMERYSYKLDKAGEPTEEPEKGGESAADHGPDALRMIVVNRILNSNSWADAIETSEELGESVA